MIYYHTIMHGYVGITKTRYIRRSGGSYSVSLCNCHLKKVIVNETLLYAIQLN